LEGNIEVDIKELG